MNGRGSRQLRHTPRWPATWAALAVRRWRTAEARHQLFTSDSVIRSGEPEPSAFTASQSGYETSMSSRNAILLPSGDQIGPPQSLMQQSP